MQIKGWHVSSFGILHDYRVEGLNPQFNVFVGPNEAGKSTLLAFIQRVLFGFPRKSTSKRQFDSVHGGKLGGRLFLAGEDGLDPLIVERFAGRHGGMVTVTLPGGERHDESWLTQFLSGADAEVFENVFAFSLTELQDFASLDNERVRGRLFSAGIAGAGAEALAVAQEFGKQADALYKPRGRKLEGAREILAEIEELNERLVAARGEAEQYGSHVDRRKQLRGELDNRSADLGRLTIETARLQKLIELHPTWVQLGELRQEMAGMPEPVEYPPDGLMKLSRLDQWQEDLSEKAAQIDGRAKAQSAEIERISEQLDPSLPSLQKEIHQFEDGLVLQQNRIERLQQLRARADQAVAERNAQFVQLPGSWDYESVQAFQWGADDKEALASWRSRIPSASRRLDETVREEQEAGQRCASLENELAALEKQASELMSGLSGDPGQTRKAIADYRTALGQAESLDAQLRAGQAGLDLLESSRQDAAAACRRSVRQLQFNWTIAAFWMLVLVAFGLWRFSESDPFLGWTLLILGVTALALGAWVGHLIRSLGKEARVRLAELEPRFVALKEETETGQAARSSLANDLKRIAGILGFEQLPNEDELASLERDLLEQDRRGMQGSVWQEQMSKLRSELEQAHASLEKCRARHRAATEEKEAAESGFAAWLEEKGLSAITGFDQIDSFLAALRLAREKIESVQSINRELDQLQREITVWNADAAVLLQKSGRPLPPEKGVGAFLQPIHELAEAFLRDWEKRREIERLQADLLLLEKEQDSNRERSEEEQARRKELFDAVGVSNAQEYREGFEREQRRAHLRQRAEAIETNLAQVSLPGEGRAALIELLEGGRPENWKERLGTVEQQLDAGKEERDGLIQELARVEDQIEHIERSVDIPGLSTRLAERRAVLSDVMNRWIVLKLSEKLIHQSLHKFVIERQPGVLATASRFFERVTHGRYAKVLQNEVGSSLMVMTPDGGFHDPRVLSRGTAEQLYLCLRLGLIEEYAQNACRLPLVMDDVLVNFDPERARAMAELLVEFSENHQVLLFTCHPSTAEMFSTQGENVAVWTLGGE
jgi:uncharacterized protein YhaN